MLKFLAVNHPTGSLWKAGFEAAYPDIEYKIKSVENISEEIASLKSSDILLCNTLLELNDNSRKLFDKLNFYAEKTDRINCIINKDNQLTGYNTASEAFILSILEVTSLKGKNCVVIGAGKVARSIVLGLTKEGANLTILNRNIEKAEIISKEYGCKFGFLEELKIMNRIDILINATSCGRYPNIEECPIPENLVKADFCFDVIINPIETKFLKAAETNGCKIIEGYKMFGHQIAIQCELTLNKKVPIDNIYNSLRKQLQMN